MFQLVAFKINAIIKPVYCFNWLPWTSAGSSQWKVFLKINFNLIRKHWNFIPLPCIEKSSVDWPWESMLCYETSPEYQYSAEMFVENIFNPFHITVLFLYFLEYIRKPEVSWFFLGGIERNQSHEMGWESFDIQLLI